MRPFSLLVKPAGAACNIACDYCFYLSKSGIAGGAPAVMPEETLEKILRSYLSLPFDSYAVTFQGGEPLLAGRVFFEKAAAVAKSVSGAAGKVAFSVQTNGILATDEMAEFFAREGWLLGVSVDGDAGLHDAHRKYRDGRGSFRDVMDALAVLDAHGCEYNILALVNADTVRSPERVYRFLRDNINTRFLQFTQCLEQVGPEEWDRFLCRIADVWKNDGDIGRVFVRNIESALSHILLGRAADCIYADSCDGYFVVERNGDVFPCDFSVEDSLRLGNAARDPWEKMASDPRRLAFAARKCPRHNSRNPAALFERKLRGEIIPLLNL